MNQLLLDIAPEWQPSLDNFVAGCNLELLAALRAALAGEGTESCFYVWGADGCGKSHLLQACARAAPDAIYVRGSVPQPAAMVALDDVECLDETAQVALFDLYNQMRDSAYLLLVSGTQAPQHLKLREDLRTRLAWGLVYQIQELSDAEKVQALLQHAKGQGYALSADVANYLLRHGKRDLHSLIASLDALDLYARRLHRVPSVSLLKEILPSRIGV
jgi:DnaA-homolog protein